MQAPELVQQKNTGESESTMLLIQKAQDYIAQLQSGDDEQAKNTIFEIYQLNIKENEQGLYHKVGKLTRELHDSINGFMTDSRMQLMTSKEMPDARQRLNYVVELTEQSAHKTMTLIEHSNPLVMLLQERACAMQKQLTNHNNNQQGIDAPELLIKELDAFVQLVQSITKKITNDLNEIMLAQDFQDLTGQVIQRVSKLVQEVEQSLVSVLNMDGEPLKPVTTNNNVDLQNKEQHSNKGHGPAVPGTGATDVLQTQDDVDDLLSSLGF